tara:strand:+ start:563 stop:973 length:411 start_codon:yes stop_codon:yes gene_type:complete
MLTENQVVKHVCDHLVSRGYTIDQSLHTDERGYDIIAHKDEKKLIIEAKGATSSKPGTSRYGKEFNRNQVKTHVSVALYAMAKVLNSNPKYDIGIALPYNKQHIEVVGEIKRALEILSITIFWVKENGVVEVGVID